jgi:hypothetical protein
MTKELVISELVNLLAAKNIIELKEVYSNEHVSSNVYYVEDGYVLDIMHRVQRIHEYETIIVLVFDDVMNDGEYQTLTLNIDSLVEYRVYKDINLSKCEQVVTFKPAKEVHQLTVPLFQAQFDKRMNKIVPELVSLINGAQSNGWYYLNLTLTSMRRDYDMHWFLEERSLTCPSVSPQLQSKLVAVLREMLIDKGYNVSLKTETTDRSQVTILTIDWENVE